MMSSFSFSAGLEAEVEVVSAGLELEIDMDDMAQVIVAARLSGVGGTPLRS